MRITLLLIGALLVGCAGVSPKLPTKPPVAEWYPLIGVDHDLLPKEVTSRLQMAGFNISKRNYDYFEFSHKTTGQKVTLTLNSSNLVVTVYDSPHAEQSPTVVKNQIAAGLDFKTLPKPPADPTLLTCQVAEAKGLNVRNQEGNRIASLSYGSQIKNCFPLAPHQLPLAFLEDDTSSRYVWGQGNYQGQPVLFAWNYVTACPENQPCVK